MFLFTSKFLVSSFCRFTEGGDAIVSLSISNYSFYFLLCCVWGGRGKFQFNIGSEFCMAIINCKNLIYIYMYGEKCDVSFFFLDGTLSCKMFSLKKCANQII